MDQNYYRTTSNLPSKARKVFTGKIFDVYQWEQELFDGSIATFERLSRPATVKLLPILPDNRILLVKETQPDKPEFIGLPGGRVNKDEELLAAARRELLEETGYTAREFIHFCTTQPIAKIEWDVHVFIAKGLTQTKQRDLDKGEKITLNPITLEELFAFIRSGKSEDVQLHHYFYEALLEPENMSELKKLLSV